MNRILVITTNLQQASFRLWIEALRPLLPPRGFELDVKLRPKGFLARRALLKTAGEYHAVILHRKLLDPSDARLLRQHARRILYSIDDAVMFHPHPVRWFSQWRTTRRFEATARVLDHVIAGNEYLAQMFRDRGRAVTVLPTCLDPTRYRVKQHDASQTVNLVWIGSSSTLPYLAEQVDAIRTAVKTTPLKLITIADRGLSDVGGLNVEHVPWSLESEADALLRGDIGIAPTPRDRWTMGKCGFKIIQYMAAGLPVIASPVGANAEIVTPQTGLLATDQREWVDAIIKQAGDVQLRRSMGRSGRERVAANYSLTRAADVWASLLQA